MDAETYQIRLSKIKMVGHAGRALLLSQIAEKAPQLKELAEDVLMLLYAESTANRMALRDGILNDEELFYADQAVKNVLPVTVENIMSQVQSLTSQRDDFGHSQYPKLVHARALR